MGAHEKILLACRNNNYCKFMYMCNLFKILLLLLLLLSSSSSLLLSTFSRYTWWMIILKKVAIDPKYWKGWTHRGGH